MTHQLTESDLRAFLRRCGTQGIMPETARAIAFDLQIPGDDLDQAARNLAARSFSKSLKTWLAMFLDTSHPNPPLTTLEA